MENVKRSISMLLLALLPILNLLADRNAPGWNLNAGSLHQQVVQPVRVNYCKLIQAGYFFGQITAGKNDLLASNDVTYFNGLWQLSFSAPQYQSGIKTDELTVTQKFQEGNRTPFPAASRYHRSNPDTYLAFHVAKEIGKIKSQAFGSCPPCRQESIDNLNRLLRGTYLHRMVSDIWVGPGVLKKISSLNDVNSFWLFLRCMFVDDRIFPESEPFTTHLKPLITTPDTTIISCRDEIKPEVAVAFRQCDIGGKVDTIGPELVKGVDNCPGALYRYGYIAKDNCLRVDTGYQYFRIDNDPPTIECPKDTVVDCIENYVPGTPAFTTSCQLRADTSTYGPLLTTGTNNCPDAVYEMEYFVEDTCGREARCVQQITIENDPPTITCPDDQIVECLKDIRPGNYKVTVSCDPDTIIEISDPYPVQGQGASECPGDVYEIKYKVTDGCGRSDSCFQRFTIDNAAPTITCPPDEEVDCEADINTGLPVYTISCELKEDLVISDPILKSGKKDCPGAEYIVTYQVTDECGRMASCEQKFTIRDQPIQADCPPDRVVECEKDIAQEPPALSKICENLPTVSVSGPELISGTKDCPGAVYEIKYLLADDCGREKTCTQKFVIDNEGPDIVCPPDTVVECKEDIEMVSFVRESSCGKKFEVAGITPVLIEGQENCPGARYLVVFAGVDECGREAECDQTFEIQNDGPKIECPPDREVNSEADIVAEDPVVEVSCKLDKEVEKVLPPKLVSGQRDCPGAVYEITYRVRDACDRTAECVQRFTISDRIVNIDCPPDLVVKCREDIKPQNTSSWLRGPVRLDHFDGPTLIQGREGCDGAIYEVVYYLDVVCDSIVTCIQQITISNEGPKITCPPDAVISDLSESFDRTPKAEVDCGLEVYFREGNMDLISGNLGENGSVYEILHVAEDECGREDECRQRITLLGLETQVTNPNPCNCADQWWQASSDLVISSSDAFNKDIAKLLRAKTCKELQNLAEQGVQYLFREWASREILDEGYGIASGIAKRGNIAIVLSKIGDIKTGIQVIEAALYGDEKEMRDILTTEFLTRAATYLAGSATPARVITAIKDLGKFTAYLNQDILVKNLKTFAVLAERDPNFFDADHFLVTYAGLNDLKIPGQNVGNKYRMAIYDYAQYRMNGYSLPYATRIWDSQQNLNAIRTVARTMLNEVCAYYCYKKRLKNHVDLLKAEQSFVERFQKVWAHFKDIDCQGQDVPDCTIPNASLQETSPGNFECVCDPGFKFTPDNTACVPAAECVNIPNSTEVFLGNRYDCECNPGYKWNPGQTGCVPYEDCSGMLNVQEVYTGSAYECDCLPGFKWDPNHDHCVTFEDCGMIANSEEVFNGTEYTCDCITGYQWNATRTACVQALDCSAFPNTAPVWNAAIQDYECDCIQGYEWNGDFTACIESAPDCASFYPNTHAVYNTQLNRWECDCLPGYKWNLTNTACEDAKPDCVSFYPNTYARWNAQLSRYECDCIAGYEWNADGSGCVEKPVIPDCSIIPNTIVKFNRRTNQYYCDCVQGYKWNAGRTGCEKVISDPSAIIDPLVNIMNTIRGGTGTADNPVVSPENQRTGVCNTTYKSGSNAPEQYTIDVGQTFGSVNFSFETYQVKDRIHVYHGGTKVFDTGCVGANGGQSIPLNGFSSTFRIIVDPTCDGSQQHTDWNFTLGCPN